MKTLLFVLLLLFQSLVFAQTVKDTLKIDNKESQVFAIINPDIYKDTLSTNDEGDEVLSDFIHYSKILSININYPVNIYTCKNIFYNNVKIKLPKSFVFYIIIKRKCKDYKIIQGPDTSDSLKDEINEIYKMSRAIIFPSGGQKDSPPQNYI